MVSPSQSEVGSLWLSKDFVLHTDDDCDLKLEMISLVNIYLVNGVDIKLL